MLDFLSRTVVTKPFDREELLAKVQVYLRLNSVEEVDRLKSGVLQWVCHETRTPLSGIIAPTQMLIDDNDMEQDERQHYLEMIHQSAVRLHSLFDKVIKLSELKSGKKTFIFGKESLGSIIQSAILGVYEYVLERQVQIDYEEISDFYINVDKSQMKSAIANLLQYAIRLSPMDSRVVVQLSKMDDTIF